MPKVCHYLVLVHHLPRLNDPLIGRLRALKLYSKRAFYDFEEIAKSKDIEREKGLCRCNDSRKALVKVYKKKKKKSVLYSMILLRRHRPRR